MGLRSASTGLLQVPGAQTMIGRQRWLSRDHLGLHRLISLMFRPSAVTVGSRAFPVADAKVWNSLPDDVTSAPTLSTFRRHLKTYLFCCCYNTVYTLLELLTLTIVVLVVALLLRPL